MGALLKRVFAHAYQYLSALIVLLTALGLLTLFIGLILAMPLVGLAT